MWLSKQQHGTHTLYSQNNFLGLKVQTPRKLFREAWMTHRFIPSCRLINRWCASNSKEGARSFEMGEAHAAIRVTSGGMREENVRDVDRQARWRRPPQSTASVRSDTRDGQVVAAVVLVPVSATRSVCNGDPERDYIGATPIAGWRATAGAQRWLPQAGDCVEQTEGTRQGGDGILYDNGYSVGIIVSLI